jgi:hypothetical protein
LEILPVVPIAVTDAFKSLNEVESVFGLVRSHDPEFFTEWLAPLPDLTVEEKINLDRVKASYLHSSNSGALTESTVNLLVTSPLLYLAGFCDPPFQIRGEVAVNVTAEENGLTYTGRIDALVLHQQFWLLLVESKQTKFSFSIALPQALAYLMSNPNPQRSTYGLVTNGDGFLFLKVTHNPTPTYGLSDDFSMFTQSRNELWDVLGILKQLSQSIKVDP